MIFSKYKFAGDDCSDVCYEYRGLSIFTSWEDKILSKFIDIEINNFYTQGHNVLKLDIGKDFKFQFNLLEINNTCGNVIKYLSVSSLDHFIQNFGFAWEPDVIIVDIDTSSIDELHRVIGYMHKMNKPIILKNTKWRSTSLNSNHTFDCGIRHDFLTNSNFVVDLRQEGNSIKCDMIKSRYTRIRKDFDLW